MDVMHDVTSVDSELERVQSRSLHLLGFGRGLEDRFESDTSAKRSRRLWFEGLLAIVIANVCMVADYLFVQDGRWQTMVLRALLLTPVALIVNSLMRSNPRRWLREGSVAAGTTVIAFINLNAQGNATAATAMFGLVSVLITMLFTGVIMRLRFPYAVSAIWVMSGGALWSVAGARGLQVSEKVVAGSLLIASAMITLLANYSMEREERVNYLLTLRGELQSRDLLEMNAKLQRLSGMDKLTGLPNRRAFEDRFESSWRDAEGTGRPLSQIVIDVDHFKQINDTRGHLYGDAVLERIASLLPQSLRGQTDFVARFGGEEFVVLLPGMDEEHALGVAERIRSLVEVAGTPAHEVGGGEFLMWTTVSCGVSTCVPEPGMRREELLAAADRALYRAKKDGRNCVRFKGCVELMEA